MTRRDAFRASTLSAASYARILGANDRIGLGVVGTGGRGSYVMSLFQKNAEVDVRALCDVYAVRLDAALGKAPGAKTFPDHRKLLELKEVDAVLVGTPDHWHAGTTIDAVRAGKDVYVEKPLTRLREEGPAITKEVRIHERICQVGMQQRSGPVYLEAKAKYVDTGALGKISNVRCVWHSGAPRPLRQEPRQCPSSLDWARFLGPVKWRDWYAPMYNNFRAFLDFNGGKMTDFGAHWIDVVHMFMGVDAPLSVAFAGGVYFDFKDGRTAPDTVSALYEYPGGFSVTFESHSVQGGEGYGITFYGDKANLFIDRNRYEYRLHEKGAPVVVQKFPGDCTADHVRNFLDCCQSRKRPNGDVWIGHRGAQAALLAVQAYQEQRRLKFDGAREEVLPL
jgi:predicted dehydrogenase